MKTLLSVIVVLLISTGFVWSAGVHEYPLGESEQAVYQDEESFGTEDLTEVEGVEVKEPEVQEIEIQDAKNTVEQPTVQLVADTVEVEVTDGPQEQNLEESSEPAENSNVETIYGGTLNVGTQVSEEELGVYMEFVPYWITPFGSDQAHDFIFALRTFAGDDLLSTTPEFSLALINNLVFVGTSFPLGFDFSDEEDVEFTTLQKAWTDVGYAWKFASLSARVEYEVEYTNLPEQNVSISSNAYWHFRDRDHNYPYPWTITVGPNAKWAYSFNNDESFARDQIFLGARVEFQSMAQTDDEFPRAWSPLFAMTFLNRWEQQEWEMNSYEWIWDPAMVFELGLNPLTGIDFSFFAEVPIGNVSNDVYVRNELNFKLQLSAGLY